jgi:hypothetical protein
MAWNYPHVYARALSQTSSDLTLDQRLNQLLGFSPAMLALAIAERWRLTPIMRASIGDNVALEMLDPAAQAKAKALRKVCEAGEALARYLHPQHFPDAEQDWENASTFVKAELGASGLRVILSGVEQYLLRLGDRWPGGLPLPDQLSHVLSDAPPPARAERRNRYLTALTPALRENLEFVYQTLPYNGVSRDSLDTLLKRAIPLAGFERGIVYLFDPDSMRLVPRVGIGPVRVGSLNPIHPSAHTSGVAIALQSLVPHEGRRSEIDGSAVCSIAGSLGLEQRAGVLYLEAGSTLMSTPAQHRITIFKALRQTLTDILRLS